MADTGTKNYIATENTAQEILTMIDLLALEDDVTNLKTSLDNTMTNAKVKFGWKNFKYGSVASNATATLSGTGVITLIFTSGGSSGATSTIVIDGKTLNTHQPYENNGHGGYTLHTFKSSVKITGASAGAIYYVAGIE